MNMIYNKIIKTKENLNLSNFPIDQKYVNYQEIERREQTKFVRDYFV